MESEVQKYDYLYAGVLRNRQFVITTFRLYTMGIRDCWLDSKQCCIIYVHSNFTYTQVHNLK